MQALSPSFLTTARVLPDFFVDDEEILRTDLAPASLSVHLLGSDYHAATERQIAAATELSKPVVIWLSPAAPATTDPRQASLIRQLSLFEGRGRNYTFLQ